jgi:hypothetical protein
MASFIESEHIMNWFDNNHENIFYTGLPAEFKRILPSKLTKIISTVFELIREYPIDLQKLKEIKAYAKELIDAYYTKYISGSLPTYIYFVSNRVVIDIKRIIHQNK